MIERQQEIKTKKIASAQSGNRNNRCTTGASWDGFVLEQVIRRLGARNEKCFFGVTHAGAELDLLIVRGRRRLGFEIKRTSSPQITKSMRNALSDLKLNHLDIIHAGDLKFPLNRQVRAVSFSRLLKDLKPLL